MSLFEALSAFPLITIGGAAILGLMVGSFLNVVIYRLPIMMEREWKTECRLILELDDPENPTADPTQADEPVFNLAQPNSCCPSCNAPIKPWQNIPVLSYLFLKGRCANCSTGISVRYPTIEAVTGLLSGLVAWHFGATPETLAILLFTWCLVALTMIDADHQILPDQITIPLLWAGLLVNSFQLIVPIQDAVWGAMAGYLSLWSVYWGFKLLTGKEGMGYGDFKLLAALGAWMGWQSILMIILLSSIVGAIVGTCLLIRSKKGRDTAIPFGPYLAAAGWIAMLWGEQLLGLYLDISGLS